MKLTAMVTITMLAGISPNLVAAKSAPTRKVTVCLLYAGNLTAIVPSQMTASRLFQETGVKLVWAVPSSCPADGIHVSLTRSTPVTFHPDALAYALPYEGTHIQVFLDRIERNSRTLVPQLLGYVLAHEIAHVIQGIDRHSDSGVMKAYWDGRDFNRMEGNQLGFAQEDVELILLGLDRPSRAARSPAGVGAKPAL